MTEHDDFIAALFGKDKAGQQEPPQEQAGPPPPAAPQPGAPGQAPPTEQAGQQLPATEATAPAATDTERQRQEETAAIEEVVAAVTLPENLPGWQAAAAQAHGLPPALAPRLQGNTEAGVYVDASRLATSLGTGPGAAEKALLQRGKERNAALLRSIHPAPRHTEGEET